MNNQTTENDTTGIVPKANTIEELRTAALIVLLELDPIDQIRILAKYSAKYNWEQFTSKFSPE